MRQCCFEIVEEYLEAKETNSVSRVEEVDRERKLCIRILRRVLGIERDSVCVSGLKIKVVDVVERMLKGKNGGKEIGGLNRSDWDLLRKILKEGLTREKAAKISCLIYPTVG